jgi:glucosamine--fructose-6-phosphate aminotransferase (isomerizing)
LKIDDCRLFSSKATTKNRRFHRKMTSMLKQLWRRLRDVISAPLHFGKCPDGVPKHHWIFFPVSTTRICCGIACIVARGAQSPETPVSTEAIAAEIAEVMVQGFSVCTHDGQRALGDTYLGGSDKLEKLFKQIWQLKTYGASFHIQQMPETRETLADLAKQLTVFQETESLCFEGNMGSLSTIEVDIMSSQLERLKDITWCLEKEILTNLNQIDALIPELPGQPSLPVFQVYHQLNAVLNSIDCLEVRGRDSAGVSVLLDTSGDVFETFLQRLKDEGLEEAFTTRRNQNPLVDSGIRVARHVDGDGERISLAFVYKVAAEIGRLGDNIRYIRDAIHNDAVLKIIISLPHHFDSILSHTRWASVGAINVINCHPVDHQEAGGVRDDGGIIHVCLNGDIDNYQELRAELLEKGVKVPGDVTTDTKIIPLLVADHMKDGCAVEEAFRRAVNTFEGSHAIAMQTDFAPGKLFIAQKGSGQTIFVGLGADHFMATSEIYGFIEATQRYIKLEGEKVAAGKDGPTQGQIFVLDEASAGDLAGIHAIYYDGTPIDLSVSDLKHTEITSRDINRQAFDHYFLKEISESPSSVARTLQNRWHSTGRGDGTITVRLDEATCPAAIADGIANESIRRIYFVGQGTAGVAAKACADILNAYFNDPRIYITALKASELSGFKLQERNGGRSMNDCLVIAISQSGTTTDTNRTVDMVRERGASTLAIVNRRDSDITFKVDGVMYTSSGRDIEMSVASTKAFYSQIVAGAVLGLFLAKSTGHRDDDFISEELNRLRQLPDIMRQILAQRPAIAASAQRLAAGRTYWAAVGSGPNKASADEIRIKLSELCYKTISSDFVEDKKHIDLSSEPLIIVCAAGTREAVLGDIVKDTAIFHAHKATPVVIADEGEHRFDPYAADVFRVPPISEHLAPIANTLVGHLWGYHAALAINAGSGFFFDFQEALRRRIEAAEAEGLDVYELVLEKSFREFMLTFYKDFRRRESENRLPAALGLDIATDLALSLKYIAGRLPVSDYELDFGIKGTAANMINTLSARLSTAINTMARPVDAIKHQAKTVTVGTSRITEKLEGILFDALNRFAFTPPQLTNRNVLVMKNVSPIIEGVRGAIRYRIDDLSALGEPTEDTTIHVEEKEGSLAALPSRVESDPSLKGTKRIIAREGNIYIGKGRKDNRNIVVIPILSSTEEGPSVISHMLLLHVGFRADASTGREIQGTGRQARTHQKHRPGEFRGMAGRPSRAGGHGGSLRVVGGKNRRGDRSGKQWPVGLQRGISTDYRLAEDLLKRRIPCIGLTPSPEGCAPTSCAG